MAVYSHLIDAQCAALNLAPFFSFGSRGFDSRQLLENPHLHLQFDL